MKKNNGQQRKLGSALLLSSVLLFVVLSMVVTLTYVTVMEQGMSQKTKSTVGAFFNADSGIEWALNKIASAEPASTIASTFGNPASGVSCPFDACTVYFLDEEGKVITEGTKYISDIKAVRAVGQQIAGQPTQRAIEAVVGAGSDIDWGNPSEPYNADRDGVVGNDTVNTGAKYKLCVMRINWIQGQDLAGCSITKEDDNTWTLMATIFNTEIDTPTARAICSMICYN